MILLNNSIGMFHGAGLGVLVSMRLEHPLMLSYGLLNRFSELVGLCSFAFVYSLATLFSRSSFMFAFV